MISPDDPRLTAYASGDLPPEEAARFENEMALDPAACAEVDRLRALQTELKSAFATEENEAPVEASDRVVAFATPEPPQNREWRWPAWLGPLAAAACVVLIAGALLLPSVGRVRSSSKKSIAASNLRQIGQATLIYASDHRDKLPVASDIWTYAGELARDGGLDDALIWIDGRDPASVIKLKGLETVLTDDRSAVDLAFRKMIPSWAVPLGELTTAMPPTTPIVWTRGLQPDGTWSSSSPYGGDGGYVVFMGGNVHYYRDTRNAFPRFDGGGTTSNILEALPPGTRIGEYVPTEAERLEWASFARTLKIKKASKLFFWPALWLVTLFVLILQAVRRRWSYGLLFGFILISFFFLWMTTAASCGRFT